jgi:IS4 transposase
MILDGSRCDAIRRRLKLLWREKSVVLPGHISALYDLGKGICRQVMFSPNAAEHELKRVEVMLEQIPKGTLLMGDRLYAVTKFWLWLQARGLWGLFRRNKLVKFHNRSLLSRGQHGRLIIEDWLVTAGHGAHKVRLRWIRSFRQGAYFELVTTVLDPNQLSAAEALQLYPHRWQVERLFYDLKEVLNLHRFYAANPNAVAMQIYAAAIVHTACRVMQARLAQQQGISPEQLSPAKLYPLLAAAACHMVHLELYHRELEAMYGLMNRPSLAKFQFATTTLDAVLVEKRKPYRRKKRFSPQRKKWKSLTHITGFKKLS